MEINQNSPARPEKNIRIGPVRAAIWKQNGQTRDGRPFESKKVVLERSYKDRYGEWKSTNRYDLNDIPKAILALEKAYAHILEAPSEESGSPIVEEVVL